MLLCHTGSSVESLGCRGEKPAGRCLAPVKPSLPSAVLALLIAHLLHQPRRPGALGAVVTDVNRSSNPLNKCAAGDQLAPECAQQLPRGMQLEEVGGRKAPSSPTHTKGQRVAPAMTPGPLSCGTARGIGSGEASKGLRSGRCPAE